MRGGVCGRHHRQRAYGHAGGAAARRAPRAPLARGGKAHAALPRTSRSGRGFRLFARNFGGQPRPRHRRGGGVYHPRHQKGGPAGGQRAADFHRRQGPARGVHRRYQDEYGPHPPPPQDARPYVRDAGSGAAQRHGGGHRLPQRHCRRAGGEKGGRAHPRRRYRRRARLFLYRQIPRRTAALAVQAGGHHRKAGYPLCQDAGRAYRRAGRRLAHRPHPAVSAGGRLPERAGLFRLPLPRHGQPLAAHGGGVHGRVPARLLCGGGAVPPAPFALRPIDDRRGRGAQHPPLAGAGAVLSAAGVGSAHRGERAHAQIRRPRPLCHRGAGAGRHRRQGGAGLFARHHHRGAFGHLRLHRAGSYGHPVAGAPRLHRGGGQHRHLRHPAVGGAPRVLSGHDGQLRRASARALLAPYPQRPQRYAV